MSKPFHAFQGEDNVSHSFAKDYSLYIDEWHPGRGLVKISTTDTTSESTLITFTPRRARAIASALLDAAVHVEQSCKVGDEVDTAEQLDSLPIGAILLCGSGSSSGSPMQKMHDESWESTTFAYVDARRVTELYGPFTILHLPEETE